MRTPRFIAFFAGCLLVVGSMFPRAGYSQRASTKEYDVAVDFVDLFVHNMITGQLELKTSIHNSLVLRAHYITTIDYYTAFGIGGAYRFYIQEINNSRSISGASIAPAVDLFFFKSNTLGKSDVAFSVGADAAYKWIFGDFSVEPEVGFRIGINPGSEGVSSYTGGYPEFSILLGYAW